MPEQLWMVGAFFKLKKAMLGVNVGDVGYVFNQCGDFDVNGGCGIQVIFSNGNYDGFSVEEQELYLEFKGFNLNYVEYNFKNVLQVSRDYSNGYWSW